MSRPPADQFYFHEVTKGASSAFAIIFCFSGLLHIYQSIKYKSLRLTLMLPVACSVMAAGFICREVSAFNHSDLTSSIQGLFYTATYCFTIPLYGLLLYLHYVFPSPPCLLPNIQPWWYILFLSTFTSAIITCISQGCATFFSNTYEDHSSITSGKRLIESCLFLQLALNFIYIIVWKVYLYRWAFNAVYRPREQTNGGKLTRQHWTIIITMYVMVALIMLTNVFRAAQIFAKTTSKVWIDEGYFWGFEVATMVVYDFLWHIMHPGRFIGLSNGCCEDRPKRKTGIEEGKDHEVRKL